VVVPGEAVPTFVAVAVGVGCSETVAPGMVSAGAVSGAVVGVMAGEVMEASSVGVAMGVGVGVGVGCSVLVV